MERNKKQNFHFRNLHFKGSPLYPLLYSVERIKGLGLTKFLPSLKPSKVRKLKPSGFAGTNSSFIPEPDSDQINSSTPHCATNSVIATVHLKVLRRVEELQILNHRKDLDPGWRKGASRSDRPHSLWVLQRTTLSLRTTALRGQDEKMSGEP